MMLLGKHVLGRNKGYLNGPKTIFRIRHSGVCVSFIYLTITAAIYDMVYDITHAIKNRHPYLTPVLHEMHLSCPL